MVNPRYYLLLAVLAGSSCQDDVDKAPTPAKTTADFTYSGTLQNFTPVQFTNQATEAQSYAWSFGDGQTSTDANPAHTFRRAGTYQVRLQATGPNGSADVTKTLTLAQADTAGLIVGRMLGSYRFGKVIRTVYGAQGMQVTRLRDTTLALTSTQPRTVTMGGRVMPLRNSTTAWPVTGRTQANYLFDDVPVPSNYTQLFQAQQGDSLIFLVRLGGIGTPTYTTYYGKKLP